MTLGKDVSFGNSLQKIPAVRWLAALQVPSPLTTELYQAENAKEKSQNLLLASKQELVSEAQP